MRIVLYGATGMVGSALAAEALRRGHDLTAVSRRGTEVEGAVAVAAEIADTERLLELAQDADAVVLSVPPDRTGGSAEPMVEAHRQLIAVRPTARLVVVGGAGSLKVGDGLLLDSPSFPAAARPEAEAFTTILGDYQASEGLDWTFVSPSPVIAPGEATGYVLGDEEPAGDHVSTADFAAAILDELEQPAHTNRRFTVASKA